MNFLTAAASIASLFVSVANAELERSYTDDLGVTHTTTLEKPTIVTFAHTAVSLFEFGLGTDQLLGTYGEYLVSNSDYDFDSPEQSSSYTADPEPSDIKKLQDVANLSPECERTPGYCTSIDIDKLVELNPDYFFVHGYAGSPWAMDNATFFAIQEVFPLSRIIFSDVSLEGDDCTVTENCYGKSMIDIIEEHMELATFLNLEEPAALQENIKELCNAATEFSTHMQTAHEKGIRTMASYVDPSSAYYASPVNDMVLRMFEELGMPILHIGKCEECSLTYFWETIPTESYFASCDANTTDFTDCNDNTLYPVDVWLYDHRVRPTIFNEDFAVVFPDKAVLAGQAVEWPIGGRKITPSHAAEILRSVGPSISGFERLHDETPCVPLDVSGMDHRKSGEGVKGAGGGEYACYNSDFHNTKYFQGCEGVDTSQEGPTDGDSGGCYDMQVHKCGCEADRCNRELCEGMDDIWTPECPNHCKDCAGGAPLESSHDSHDDHDHDHDHTGDSDDELEINDLQSSSSGCSVFGVAVAMVTLVSVFGW